MVQWARMKPSVQQALRRFAGRGGDGAPRGTFTVDDLQGLLLQVSFAIMMVFMMAYFLFRTQSQRKQEAQLLEIERQKLVIAVDAVRSEYRGRYGLDVLLPGTPQGNGNAVVFDPTTLVHDGALVDNAALRGAFLGLARNAASDFANPIGLRREWLARVADRAGLAPSALSRANADWLDQAADREIAGYEDDIRRVEFACASELQRHWRRTPSAIGDPAVADILDRFNRADEAGRLLLIIDLSDALKRHSFAVLSQWAGADMLP